MEGQSAYAASGLVSTICRSLVRGRIMFFSRSFCNCKPMFCFLNPHSIGYPVVTLGFGFKSYVNFQMRQRKQRDISKENLFFLKLMQDALPAEEPLRPLEDSANQSSCSATAEGLLGAADSFHTTSRDLVPIHSTAMQLATPLQPQHSINSSHHHHNSNTHHHPKHAQSSQSSKAGATSTSTTTPTSSTTQPNGNATSYTHSNGSVPASTTNNNHHRPNRRSSDKASVSESSTKPYLQTSSTQSAKTTSSSSSHSSKETTNGKLPNHTNHQSSSESTPVTSRDKDTIAPSHCNGRAVKSTIDHDWASSCPQSSSPIADGSANAKHHRLHESNDPGSCDTGSGGGPTSKDSKPTFSSCKNSSHHNGGVLLVETVAPTITTTTTTSTIPTAEPTDNVAVEKAAKG